MVHNVSKEMVTVISCVPRISDRAGSKGGAGTYYESISNDEETTLKPIVQITSGITGVVDKV